MPDESRKYFGEEGDGMHMMFNFYVNQYIFYALATADIKPLAEALEATRIHFPTAQWAQFLRNHDELELTEEQRARVFERFGPEKRMQLYERGIRRRLSPMLGNRQQTELAYSLIFSLPGTPVIRYGDEIGMGDDLSLRGCLKLSFTKTFGHNSDHSPIDKRLRMSKIHFVIFGQPPMESQPAESAFDKRSSAELIHRLGSTTKPFTPSTWQTICKTKPKAAFTPATKSLPSKP